MRRFELERSCCFSALLLDEERGRLFVGAKNFLLSLSLDNIAKQEHKVGQSLWNLWKLPPPAWNLLSGSISSDMQAFASMPEAARQQGDILFYNEEGGK